MTSQIKAIIFDFGNVLLEWDPRYVYQRYFPNDPEGMERFLTEVNFAEWNLAAGQGSSVCRRCGNPFRKISTLRPAHPGVPRNWTNLIGAAYNGTIEILKKLKQAGYPLYGLSNWSAETSSDSAEKYDFLNLFDDFVISGDVGHVKPDPEIFQIILEKIRRPAQQCLFIDDALTNINQAQKMGFATIHFQSPEQLKSSLHTLRLFLKTRPLGQANLPANLIECMC